MVRRGGPRVWSVRWGKWLLNLYPPFLFNRIRVVEFADGYLGCTVRVSRSLLTRNLNGTIFGGTIFSAADPFYALMYWQVFARRGEKVLVWLKSAKIEYLKPAATALELRFRLTEADVEQAAVALARNGRFARAHGIDVVDRNGQVCARVETEVYVRRTRKDQREVSAF